MIITSDILLRCGARTLLDYGVPSRRVAVPLRGGELSLPAWTRADGGTPIATFIGNDGNLYTAAANVPRVQWYDLDGDGTFETPVLLIEPSGIQAFTFSRQLDNAAWTKTDVTVTANATAAPDRAIAGDKLVEGVVNGGHNVFRNCPTITDNTLQSWSFFAKAAERVWVHLRTADKAGGVQRSWFNLTTGAWGTKDAGHNLRFWKLANGWYRLMCSFNSATGATQPTVAVALSNADNIAVYQGDGASGLYAWGLQFETDRVFPTSFVYSDSALTRAADVFSARMSFGVGPLSVYSKFIEAGNHLLGLGQPRVWWIGKTDLSTPFIGLQNNGGYSLRWNPGSGLVSSLVGSQAPVPGDIIDGVDTLNGQSIQRTQSLNGGAAAVGNLSTATGVLPATFSDTVFSLMLSGMGVELQDLFVVRGGARTLAECRAVP